MARTPATPRPARKSSKKPAAAAKPATFVETLKEVPQTAEARVKAILDRGKPAIERAQAMVNETQKNLTKQGKAIQKDLAHRVADIGTRVDKERKTLGRKVESAVKTTLASLNIPTRSEINLLARRVEELSVKIDSLKRRR